MLKSFAGALRLVAAVWCAALFINTAAHAQKWSTLAPFPDASEEVYGIASGGKLYVLGGLGPAWTPKGLVYEFDPAINAWTKKKNMPLPSHHVAVAELNGKIYVMGGEVRNHIMSGTYRALEAYDAATNTWSTLRPMVYARHGSAADFIGNRFHVVSGNVQSAGGPGAQVETDAHEVFDVPAK